LIDLLIECYKNQ